MSAHTYSPGFVKSARASLAELAREIGKLRDLQESARKITTGRDTEIADFEAQAADLRHILRDADPDRAGQYADPQPERPDHTESTALVRGLRELADWVEQHPEVIWQPLASLQLCITSSTDDYGHMLARVEQAAAVMGCEATWRGDDTQYVAVRRFGHDVTLTAAAIPKGGRRIEPEPVAPADVAVLHAAAAFDDESGWYTTSCGLQATGAVVVDADLATCPACNTAVRAQDARVARTALDDDPQHEHEFVLVGMAEDAEPEDCSCGMTYRQYDAGMGERIAEALEARSGATS